MKCPKCGHDFEPEVVALAVSVNTAAIRAQTDSRKLREAAYRHAAERVVFPFWRERTGRTERTLYDSKRERYILARLRENGGNVSELLFAVDGLAKSEFHCREGQDGIEQVFRDRSQVEKFCRLAKWDGRRPHPFLGDD